MGYIGVISCGKKSIYIQLELNKSLVSFFAVISHVFTTLDSLFDGCLNWAASGKDLPAKQTSAAE